MVHSMVFHDGKLVAQNLDWDSLKKVVGDRRSVVWVDMDDPTDEETKRVLEEIFNFHPLAIEDCVMLSHFPKLEEYEEYAFMVMHAVDFSRTDKFNTTELNLFMGKNFLVTYYTAELKSVQSVRDRLVNKPMASMARSADRITHLVLDAMMEHYRPVMREFSMAMEQIEEKMLVPGSGNLMQEALDLRRDISHLRQIIRPQRDVVNRLARGECKLVSAQVLPYFRDLHDDLTRLEESASSFHDRLMLDFDVYFNRTANETNESIKVLTALTALTLPPTIIGGWYGMNFTHIPELSHPHAYTIVLVITLLSMLMIGVWLKLKNLL